MTHRIALRDWIDRVERNGYLPLLALTIAIQGTVLISQTLASLLIPLERIGAIRTFESIASVAILTAGLGTQTMAVRELAATRDMPAQERILADLLSLPVLGAVLIGLLAITAAAIGHPLPSLNTAALPPAIALLLLVNWVRLMSSAAQGLFQVARVYRAVIAGSTAAIIFHLGGALSGSLPGWVIGRCLGEAVLLASVVRALWQACPWLARLRGIHIGRILRLARTGLSINAALILRMAADSLPIVLMGAISARAVVGQFGIATLALTLATLPIAVLIQLTLPRLAAADDTAEGGIFRSLLLRVTAVGAAIAAAASLAGLALGTLLPPQIDASMMAIMAILWTLPLRAFAQAYGILSLARSRYVGPLLVNVVEVAALVAIMMAAPFGGTIWTPMLAVFIGAAISAAGMILQSALIGSRRHRVGDTPDDMIVVD